VLVPVQRIVLAILILLLQSLWAPRRRRARRTLRGAAGLPHSRRPSLGVTFPLDGACYPQAHQQQPGGFPPWRVTLSTWYRQALPAS
jgi:hypothetical protein